MNVVSVHCLILPTINCSDCNKSNTSVVSCCISLQPLIMCRLSCVCGTCNGDTTQFLKGLLCSMPKHVLEPLRTHRNTATACPLLTCLRWSVLEVGVAVDNPGRAEESQQAEAAGGGHVSPGAVSQLHDGAQAHCWQHLQEIQNNILNG